ncbi:hypothetical protein NDA12_002243 [Ustilago hordei]|nr:hypothetical protein NDA12_002243 [Ustilago hordei]
MLALKSQLIGAALVLAFCDEKTYAGEYAYCNKYICSPSPKLPPRKDDYKNLCEAPTDPHKDFAKWPCFTFWNGDLFEVNADTPASDKGPDDFFVVKDDTKKDFTTVDPTKGFKLKWFQNTLQMEYSNFDQEKGCFNITLKHYGSNKLRIWVSDENSKGRDIDTWKQKETSKTFCTKWVHIHVGHDGHYKWW